MGSEAVAQRNRRTHSAQRRENRTEIAREPFGAGPLHVADRPNRGMRVRVFCRCPRRSEGSIEIVERADRSGAEDTEFERARRRVEVSPGASEARRGMGEQRLRGERRKIVRPLEDEPRERPGLGLAKRPTRPNPRPRGPSAQVPPTRGARSRNSA